MPGKARATAAALSTAASRLRPGAGTSWMVISRDTSDCHSLAAFPITSTAPVVSEARNVMMATTAISARPAMELRGTSGVSKRGIEPPGMRGVAVISSLVKSVMCIPSVFLVVNMQPPVVQHQPPRIVLVHQSDVVGGDHHRGSGFIEFDEQPQQPLRQTRVDVAGRLIGQKQLWPRDHRARDRGALLLACLLYTSDAADDLLCVDLGGRRIIKK